VRAPAGWRGLAVSAALGLALAAGACRPVNPTEDARIESEIKARLVAEKNANLTRLGVLSSGGVVYLSGTVASADEKARAAVLSRSVEGVRRVVNTLEVRIQ
jgi:osmotically-inducible protein OsmY